MLSEAKKEAHALHSKAEKEIKEYEKEAIRHNEELFEALARKMVSGARFDGQRLLLKKKEELIAAVQEKVKAKILALDNSERKKFLQKLLQKARSEIIVDNVLLNEKDLRLLEGLKAKSGPLSGGLISQNKEGTVSVDLSVEELLESARHELLIEISTALFAKE